MIKNILNRFGTIYYVQIWEKRIKVTDITTAAVFDEKALVAVNVQNNKEIIEAVGDNASLLAANKNIKIVEPFCHQRLLISDFDSAVILLQYIFSRSLNKNQIFSPRVVIHPMEKIEGDLGDVEIKAFQELALSAGAREVKVYQGEELAIHNFDFDSLISAGNDGIN